MKKNVIPVVYEDENVIAINKPSGILVHGDGKSNIETIADWVDKYYPALRGVGEPYTAQNGLVYDRPGIVHRLDKETSGILLIAKNSQTHSLLKKQFQDRVIIKVYNAFLYGVLKKNADTINLPIGRSAKDFRLKSAEFGARGTLRPAVTEYKVIKQTGAFTYIEAHPKTGRTHQIRVHFKAIGHPIICDKLYAPKQACALWFDRLALHASFITFMTQDGAVVTLEAPIPPDFERALESLSEIHR